MTYSIEQIGNLFSVSGYEKNLTDYIMEGTKKYADECYRDKLGNVIINKKGKGDKILVNIPVSSNGLFITHITDDCKAKFKPIGKTDCKKLTGLMVRDENGKKAGVIYSDSEEINSIDDLYIDFGVYDKENLKVKVGDVLSFSTDYFSINDNIYGNGVSRCAVIYSALEIIKKIKSDYDLYFAFTVMDNIGFKGAKTAVFSINPDLCITCSSSFEDLKESTVKMSKGTVVRVKDSHIIVNKALRDMAIKKLADNNIPYQLEVLTNEGLSNNEIMYQNGGILTLNVNLCAKGFNEQMKCINKYDLENYKKSLEEILRHSWAEHLMV